MEVFFCHRATSKVARTSKGKGTGKVSRVLDNCFPLLSWKRDTRATPYIQFSWDIGPIVLNLPLLPFMPSATPSTFSAFCKSFSGVRL